MKDATSLDATRASGGLAPRMLLVAVLTLLGCARPGLVAAVASETGALPTRTPAGEPARIAARWSALLRRPDGEAAGDPHDPRVVPAQARTPDAVQAGSGRGLAGVLDGHGRLVLPEDFHGSLDPAGYDMVLGEDGAPRFLPKGGAGDPDSRWEDRFYLGSGCDGAVYALAVGPSGELYLGGQFGSCGGVAANRVVRFDPSDGTWSPLGSAEGNGVDNIVYALAISGDALFVGGVFLHANVGAAAVGANRIARFDTSTGTWSSLGANGGNGVSGAVRALAPSANSLYVGGSFVEANVGGALVPARGIARVDPDAGTWSAVGSAGGNGVSSDVYTLALSGSVLFVGGAFSQANIGGPSIAANNVARVDLATGIWSALGTGGGNGVDGLVTAMAVSGDDLYVGGFFSTANTGGVPAFVRQLARWSTDGWSGLGGGGPAGGYVSVQALLVLPDGLYVAGSFTEVGAGPAVPASNIARWNNGIWTALGSGGGNGTSDLVLALAATGEELYAAGSFALVNVGAPLVANNIGRWRDAAWSSLGVEGAGVNGSVSALAVSGPYLYVGGYFTTAGGIAANRIARFDTSTGAWSALGSNGGNGVSGGVRALALSGNSLFVGGEFHQANVGAPVPAISIARLDLVTGVWTPLGHDGGNGTTGSVHALAVAGDDLYVGGSFGHVNNGAVIPAFRVARWRNGTWSALGHAGGNGLNNTVHALAVSGEDLYIGGAFSQANVGAPVPANGIVRWNIATETWAPLGTGSNGVSGRVRALAVSEGDLYVGGEFVFVHDGASAIEANGIARWSNQTWSALGSGAGRGVNGGVWAVAATPGEVFVGGFFTEANTGAGVPARGVARWNGSKWSGLGRGVTSITPSSTAAQALARVDADSLHAGGQFNFAGGRPAGYIGGYTTRGVLSATVVGQGMGQVVSVPAGLDCPGACSARFQWDQPVNLTASAHPGSAFGGWSGGGCSGTAPCVLEFGQDTSVIAGFDVATYTVAGQVGGLAGGGLVLQNNGGDDLPVAADGGFTFATAVASGQPYSVTVLVQPGAPSQTCTVGNGSGVVGAGDITDVAVVCVTDTYTVGGQVGGLAGSGLVLQNNGGDDLPVAADGGFTFATAVASGQSYSVSVLVQPSAPSQTCTVGNGSGVVGAGSVTDVAVACATDSYLVAAAAIGNGHIAPAMQSVEHGAAAAFVATPDPGHHLVAVTGDTCTPVAQGGGNWVAVDIVQPCDVTAAFAVDPALAVVLTGGGSGQVTSIPAGIDCPGTCVASFPPHTAVTLTAVPAPGSRALGWAGTGSCPGAGPCTLSLDAPASVHAGFGLAAGRSLRFFGNGSAAPGLDRVAVTLEPAGRPANLGAGDFTIELWLKAAGGNDSAATCLDVNDAWIEGNIVLDRDTFGDGDHGDFGLSLMAGRLAFGIGRGEAGTTVCGGTDLRDGRWHHVAVTRDAGNGVVRLWLDGTLHAQGSGPTGDVSYRAGRPTAWPWDPFLVLGAEKHDVGPTYPSWTGWLDEVRLSAGRRYEAPFTPATGLAADASTLALYRFDEGAGVMVFDESGRSGGPDHGERRLGGAPAGPCWSDDTPALSRVFGDGFEIPGCPFP